MTLLFECCVIKLSLKLKVLYVGTPGTLQQPHLAEDSLFDKLRSKKLRVYGATRERLASSGKLRALHLIFCAYVAIYGPLNAWLNMLSG